MSSCQSRFPGDWQDSRPTVEPSRGDTVPRKKLEGRFKQFQEVALAYSSE